MEMPPKPKLERVERKGYYGETVSELTPESELRWAKYLRELNFAKQALRRKNDET